MSNVHEKDKASIDEVSRAFGDLSDKNGLRPSDREKIAVLIKLVYAKGRLRGYQEAVEEGTAVLRSSLSESVDGGGT